MSVITNEKPTILTAIGWSALACWLFGLQNYIIGYTNTLPMDNFFRTVGLLWLVTGICGIVVLVNYSSQGVFFLDDAANSSSRTGLISFRPPPIPLFPKLITLGGGLSIGAAQLLMKLSFAQDPLAQGPLCSIVCADVILVSVLCHFIYSETLTPGQWLSILVVFAGLVTMSGAGSGYGVSPMGFFFAVCSMLCFGMSVFSVII